MDSFTLLTDGIQQLPVASKATIALMLMLLPGAILLKLRQRKQLLKTEAPVHASSIPTSAQLTADTRVPARDESGDSAGAAEVYEVDPLQEVEIYLSFGHLEQAATTLRWHVEHHPEDLDNCLRLLDLYLEIPDMVGYAEIQERLCTLSADRKLRQDTIMRGLVADPDNLHLRVLADSYLGLDPEAVDAFLAQHQPAPDLKGEPTASQARPDESELARSVDKAQSALKQALVNPEPLDLSGLDSGSDKPGPTWSPTPSGLENLPLVQGQFRLTAALGVREAQVVDCFMSPIQAAAIHQELNLPEPAIAGLRRAILFEPRKLGYHVALLKILFQLRRTNHYAESLLSLYLTLWGAGKDLRERLLGLGRKLGEHPLLLQLGDVDQREGGLASLAGDWGLNIPLAAIPFSHPALVEERVRSGYSVSRSDNGDHILQEFDQLLDFGQVEEAIFLLEDTLSRDPQLTQYFHPLMEMYERTADLQRYSLFAESILQHAKLPPEETLQFMLETGERLKRQARTRVV
ncbi:hypothetical protein [Thermithiobacillus plumbiphilus]|uniref:Uncharacterized protein n=1 Tax=Thermithiobacillus plumbiphilus TaxID=1729899 RepID=A0ABU9D8T6_9PROT